MLESTKTPASRPKPKPGDQLRILRNRLELTTREVEELSKQIAADQGNNEFVVSHGRVIQLENDESTPSIAKVFSLSAIYGVGLIDLLALYVDVEQIPRYQMQLGLARSRVFSFDELPRQATISFPARFDPGFNPDRTALLSRMVEVWGDIPVAVLKTMQLRRQRYGFIGLEDYMMYPLLRPGSFVQIDDSQKVQSGVYSSEWDRPVYFIETRAGYVCSWCEFRKGKLIAIPHPLSPCRTQEFIHPMEAEVIGRVTAVAARLSGPAQKPRADE